MNVLYVVTISTTVKVKSESKQIAIYIRSRIAAQASSAHVHTLGGNFELCMCACHYSVLANLLGSITCWTRYPDSGNGLLELILHLACYGNISVLVSAFLTAIK